MRAMHKNQLIEIIGTIYEAIKICKIQPSMEILSDCQTAALTIGENIEQIEGEGTSAVSYLEEFAELIYSTSLDIEDEPKRRKALNKSRDKLRQAENEIKNKIPLSYEILFLPYKASMWDSLDSIYKAAMAQNNCHVTVMPSPYFNLGTQGEINSIEYEGKSFPQYVEITHYDSYSIPQNRPDVIFIHNPYDDCNYVTRLPQQFFSSELIKYTDRLVYVPYFVNDGSTMKEHYCQTPGVCNAWRTFVHSEKVRDIYCKFNSPEKIVAIGSPKFDMVLKYNKEKPDIPKEWAKVFKGRKVFLYNTHLRNIIGYSDELIDKMEKVFSTFKNRLDIAILWRPHPLSIQTARSMNPYILKEYMQAIEKFKKLPNGVYDDTADVHRAIALSDAYIGDESSVVSLYGVTGKPIYLMKNKGIYADNYLAYVLCHPGVKVDDEFYVFSADYNVLYNIKNGVAEFLCKIGNDNEKSRDMFSRIEKYNNELILIPDFADEIVKYNIKTKTFQSYKINVNISKKEHKASFAKIYGDSIYILIINGRLIKMNLHSGDITYFDYLFKNVDFSVPVAERGAIHNDKMYIPCMQDNRVAVWDMNTDTFSIEEIVGMNVGCRCITFCNETAYLLSTDERDVFKLNINSMYAECVLKNTQAKCIHIHNNKLFLIPDTAEFVQVFDGCLTNIQYPEGFRYLDTYKKEWCKYFDYKVENNILQLYPRNSNMYLEIDMDTLTVKGQTWALSENAKIIVSEVQDYIYTNNICGLNEFINFALNDNHKSQRKNKMCEELLNVDGSAGQKIWDYVYKNL